MRFLAAPLYSSRRIHSLFNDQDELAQLDVREAHEEHREAFEGRKDRSRG